MENINQNNHTDLGEIKLTDDFGVSKTIISHGEVDSPGPRDQMEATVHYVGTLLDGTKFDSSRDRETPFKFNLGEGEVIKAWDIGVKSMKKGEKCLLYCTAPYAYGEEGSGEKIPPNSTLKFEIELLGFDFESITSDEKIRREEIKKGEGYLSPNDGAVCKVIISGKLRHSDTVFLKESEREIVVGDDTEPYGLNTILKKMKKGEKSRFYVENSEHHYLSEKLPQGVMQEDCLEITIEMISFENKKEIYEMDDKEKLEEGLLAKEKGNILFRQGEMKKAAKKYEYAVSCLEDFPGVFDDYSMTDPLLGGESKDKKNADQGKENDDKEKEAMQMNAKKVVITCLNNLNILKMRQKEFEDVISNCEKILRIDPQNYKALYRRAMSYKEIGSYGEALSDIEKAMEVNGENELLIKGKYEIKRMKMEEEKSVNTVYKKMFKGIGRK